MESPISEGQLSLKKQKESFVSNLNGTSMLEIAGITVLVPIFAIVKILIQVIRNKKSSSTKLTLATSQWFYYFEDFIIIVIPTIMAMTSLSNHLIPSMAFTVALAIALLWRFRLHEDILLQVASISPETERNFNSNRKQFLSFYRSTMMMTTCVAILAVDFHSFPRRFAKTETFGTGLMDIGVGSFVVANGILSCKGRANFRTRKQTLSSISPLLFLGLSRLLLTKSVDYQEHVGEYGLHWNFFFTLSSVALLTSLANLSSSAVGAVGAMVIIVYQTLLSRFGLSEYLNSNDRSSDLLSLNKEGIFSSIGYFALHLTSVQLGVWLMSGPTQAKSDSGEPSQGQATSARWKWVLRLTLVNASLWALAVLCNLLIEKVSRRTCNLAYVAWMLAQNLTVILIFLCTSLCLPFQRLAIFEAFDRNALLTFLLANVMTGAVNLSVNTLAAGTFLSLAVLTVYMAVVSAVPCLLNERGISMKFW